MLLSWGEGHFIFARLGVADFASLSFLPTLTLSYLNPCTRATLFWSRRAVLVFSLASIKTNDAGKVPSQQWAPKYTSIVHPPVLRAGRSAKLLHARESHVGLRFPSSCHWI